MASSVLRQVGVTSLTCGLCHLVTSLPHLPSLTCPDSLAPVTSVTLTLLHTRTILSPSHTHAIETVRGGARIETGVTARAADARDWRDARIQTRETARPPAPSLGMPWYTCLDMLLDNVVVVGVRGVRGGARRGAARAARRLLRICSSSCLTCRR